MNLSSIDRPNVRLVDSGTVSGPREADTSGGLADTERSGDDVRTVILRYLADYSSRVGAAPTVRDIGRHVHRSISTVHFHLRALEADGLVQNLGRRGYIVVREES